MMINASSSVSMLFCHLRTSSQLSKLGFLCESCIVCANLSICMCDVAFPLSHFPKTLPFSFPFPFPCDLGPCYARRSWWSCNLWVGLSLKSSLHFLLSFYILLGFVSFPLLPLVLVISLVSLVLRVYILILYLFSLLILKNYFILIY